MIQDSEAVFVCSASGSNIEIIWRVGSNNYTREADACSSNESVCVNHTLLTHTTTTVNSTLRIIATSNVTNIECIIHQTFDKFDDYFDNSLPDVYQVTEAVAVVLLPIGTVPTDG